MTARTAITSRIQRSTVPHISSAFNRDWSFTGEGAAIARVTRWQNTIEEVIAHFNSREQILWSAYAHQITDFVDRQHRCGQRRHFPHNLFRLAHRQSPRGETVESQ